MKRRAWRTISGLSLGAIAVTIWTGCASISTRFDEYDDGYYSGVKEDYAYLRHPGDADYPYLQWIRIFDLPLSSAADTICLPYDYFSREPEEEDDEDE